MTQAPIYPGQPYPPQQQGYAQPPMQPQYQQPYPPQQAPGYPQQMPPQGYPGQMAAPAPPPAQTGSLDDYYNQAVAAGGPGISWKDKQIGTTYVGVISGKPIVQQDTDYTTKMPMFQRDGVTPKWVMLIPLSGVQTNHQTFNGQPEFPDGEVVYYARGKDKEEITRAMSEAGCSGAPAVGATFQVTLVQRKPNRQGNPTNVVQIAYTPPNGQPHQAEAQQAAAPAQPQAPQAPVQQPVQPQLQQPVGVPQGLPGQIPGQLPGVVQQQQQPQVAQPPAQVQQQAPLPQLTGIPGVPAQQVQQGVPQGLPAQQPVQQGAPAAPNLAPQPPAGMAPETAAILQGLGVQPQAG